MTAGTIIVGQDKLSELEYDLKYIPGCTLDSTVRCKKCGAEFLYKDSNVVEQLDVVGYYKLTRCKNYPECDAILQDFEIVK